jgi:hypothetical protein
MKVKLLKKLHKKYSWYFNNDKFPVLIIHSQKTVRLYDLEYLTNRFNYSLEDIKEKVKVDHTEWALRCLKLDIIDQFGWDMSKVRYKLAVRNYKRKLPK